MPSLTELKSYKTKTGKARARKRFGGREIYGIIRVSKAGKISSKWLFMKREKTPSGKYKQQFYILGKRGKGESRFIKITKTEAKKGLGTVCSRPLVNRKCETGYRRRKYKRGGKTKICCVKGKSKSKKSTKAVVKSRKSKKGTVCKVGRPPCKKGYEGYQSKTMTSPCCRKIRKPAPLKLTRGVKGQCLRAPPCAKWYKEGGPVYVKKQAKGMPRACCYPAKSAKDMKMIKSEGMRKAAVMYEMAEKPQGNLSVRERLSTALTGKIPTSALVSGKTVTGSQYHISPKLESQLAKIAAVPKIEPVPPIEEEYPEL